MKKNLAYALLAAIVLSLTLVAWYFDPNRHAVTIETETETIEQAPKLGGEDCWEHSASEDLLRSKLEVVGVFEDYICVKDKNDWVWKVDEEWEYYGFEYNFYGLTKRSDCRLSVGQNGELILNPYRRFDNFLLVRNTFELVYGSPMDLRFAKAYETFSIEATDNASKIQSEPLWTGTKIGPDYTPEQVCWDLREYSEAVRLTDGFDQICQRSYENGDHVPVSGLYVFVSDNLTEIMIDVLPNKYDRPEVLEIGQDLNGSIFLGCASIEGYETSIFTEEMETTFSPYFTYENERFYGYGEVRGDTIYSPIGVLFDVHGELQGKVMPFEALLEYKFNGQRTLYRLPLECDPTPEVSWWSQFVFWK